MKTTSAQKSTYKIEGELISLIPDPGGKLKYIQVQVGERVIPIKLAKELRSTIGNSLVEGDRLSIFLEQSGVGRFSQLKLKSDRIEKISTSTSQTTSSTSTAALISSPVSDSTFKKHQTQKGKVLICRKSSCTKRGGKQLYHALAETINHLGLQQQVSIELTDCQKQCKQAPSMTLMPGRVKHAYVHPNDLADLLTAHYL
ncbi:MAG: (2Fe-2S) ferredoxin domain-containing protein [Cyanobacteria bacterium P01_A01_bin.83]